MYRKRLKGILTVAVLTGFAVGTLGQNKQASPASTPASFSDVSLKKNKIVEAPFVRGEDILWKKDVYRMVDLKSGQNGALYYPTEPDGERMNLFSTIFDLVANNKITAYEYLDGREVFTDLYAVKFKDLLKRFEIPYKEKNDPKKPNSSIYEIDAVDIPSAEVTLFYLKEIWYLDQRSSSVKVKPTALCPVLIREDEMGESRRYPMFWIPFETIRPYLSQMAICADSLNSAARISAYDFFDQRRYLGALYKVSNLKNQTIWDYCKTPEAIEVEQERLEKSLNKMDASLWEPSQRALREEAERQKMDEMAKQKQRKTDEKK